MPASAPGPRTSTFPATVPAVLAFGVQAWAAWSPGPDGDDPPVATLVPALIRRRLSAPARMALHVVEACLGPQPADHATVFASRHGELARTLELLEQIDQEQEMSPTAFSLSVHNAAAGAYSIARRSRVESTTVAAGRDSFAQGALEALVQSRASGRPVLLVYVGGPAPGPYAEFAAPEERHSAALAMLVDASATGYALRASADAAALDDEPALIAAAVLRGERPDGLLSPAGWRLERTRDG